MNVERLRKVASIVLSDPERFAMDQWVSECGTMCCIGGHAVLDAGYAQVVHSRLGDYFTDTDAGKAAVANGDYDSIYEAALELTNPQGGNLFYVSDWPERFQVAFRAASDDPVERARIAAERIEYFISTGGE